MKTNNYRMNPGKAVWSAICLCGLLLGTAEEAVGLPWTVERPDMEPLWEESRSWPPANAERTPVIRVAPMDARLAGRLDRARDALELCEGQPPEVVLNGTERIPADLAEAVDYLWRNVCMACPPACCAETTDAFWFSGGTSVWLVPDFSSGMAVMRKDGAILSWKLPPDDGPDGETRCGTNGQPKKEGSE